MVRVGITIRVVLAAWIGLAGGIFHDPYPYRYKVPLINVLRALRPAPTAAPRATLSVRNPEVAQTTSPACRAVQAARSTKSINLARFITFYLSFYYVLCGCLASEPPFVRWYSVSFVCRYMLALLFLLLNVFREHVSTSVD